MPMPFGKISENVKSTVAHSMPLLTQIHKGYGEVDSTLALRCHGQVGYAHVGTLIDKVE